MINISTKTGDSGQSGLANGVRLSKADPIFEVLGTFDELNSWLGLCIATLSTDFDHHRQSLLSIQDTLFHAGAQIAGSQKTTLTKENLRSLENTSNNLQGLMEENWGTTFLLPGGTLAAAHLDVARTVCRRLERCIVSYSQKEKVSPLILSYINRLSDYLYILRCFVNWKENYQELPFEV